MSIYKPIQDFFYFLLTILYATAAAIPTASAPTTNGEDFFSLRRINRRGMPAIPALTCWTLFLVPSLW